MRSALGAVCQFQPAVNAVSQGRKDDLKRAAGWLGHMAAVLDYWS
jgi:hypothetical protein